MLGFHLFGCDTPDIGRHSATPEMKRIALVFIIAIMLPSILLAVLAVRTLRVQEIAASSQRVALHQSTCDAMIGNISLFMDDVRIFFSQEVDRLVEREGADLIDTFDEQITDQWSQVSVGSVVSDAGVICSPVSLSNNVLAQPFLENHADFLSNRRVVEVYEAPRLLADQVEVKEEPLIPGKTSIWGSLRKRPQDPVEEKPGKTPTQPGSERLNYTLRNKAASIAENLSAVPLDNQQAAPASKMEKKEGITEVVTAVARDSAIDGKESATRKKVAASNSKLNASRFDSSQVDDLFKPVDDTLEGLYQSTKQQVRNVDPAQQLSKGSERDMPKPLMPMAYGRGNNYSQLNRVAVTQNDLTEGGDKGAVSRIIDGRLHTLLWKRHPSLPGYTFWVELNLDEIKAELSVLFRAFSEKETNPKISFALLDSNGEPVTQTVPGFETDWATPFVAAEVGQILPRWEVAAYILDPEALNVAARTVLVTLSLIIVILVAAVAVGSFLIMRSVNYEIQIASRKTDFVSNVSHELKTPLTSIRMFSELLEKSENYDAEITRKYSSVISKESARLSRLINRLLDFSRLDRGEMRLMFASVDLGGLVRETVNDYRHQIESEGLAVEMEILPESLVNVSADRDALSQVLVNLLTNAEKYASCGGVVNVRLEAPDGGKVILRVQDRGPGISKLHQRRIFEKFYRADESISSGIEGSGIGLALSQQIIEKHEGRIWYVRRESGGSCFAIELPISED